MKKYLKKIKIVTIFSIVFIMPFTANAQFFFKSGNYPNDLRDIIFNFIDIISALIPLVIALAILFFFWGLAKFIFYADNEEKKKEGKSIMLWGIIALFIIVTIGGIIALLGDSFLGRNYGIIPLSFPGITP